MLGDTLTPTIATVPYPCAKVNQDAYSAEYVYLDADEEVTLTVRHKKTGKGATERIRHNVEMRWLIPATSTTPEVSRMCYFVMEQGARDLDTSLATALFSLVTASSGAILTKIVKRES